MSNNNKIVLFQEKEVRRFWHEEEWWFVLNDVIAVLSDTPEPAAYARKMKLRDKELAKIWNDLVITIKVSTEGGSQKMNCCNTKGLLRIVQSIPSLKAEPFKLWLSEVGYERIQEIENPEIGIERVKEIYKAKGYEDNWIDTRIKSIDTRKELTDEWKKRGVKEGQEYSILTAEIAKATFGLTPTEHKSLKKLEKENLRDHMTRLELIFTMLGEESTRQIAVEDDSEGFNENFESAQKGGRATGKARKMYEEARGTKIVSSENFLNQIEASAKKGQIDEHLDDTSNT
jgi:DNA-damage-inducible protein D